MLDDGMRAIQSESRSQEQAVHVAVQGAALQRFQALRAFGFAQERLRQFTGILLDALRHQIFHAIDVAEHRGVAVIRILFAAADMQHLLRGAEQYVWGNAFGLDAQRTLIDVTVHLE